MSEGSNATVIDPDLQVPSNAVDKATTAGASSFTFATAATGASSTTGAGSSTTGAASTTTGAASSTTGAASSTTGSASSTAGGAASSTIGTASATPASPSTYVCRCDGEHGEWYCAYHDRFSAADPLLHASRPGHLSKTGVLAFVQSADRQVASTSQDRRELSVSTIYEYCNADWNPCGVHERAVVAKTFSLSHQGDIVRTDVPVSQVLEWFKPTNPVENQGSECVDSMVKIHVQEDALRCVEWACRTLVTEISDIVEDIDRQEVAMHEKCAAGQLPPLCAIVQELTQDARVPNEFPMETAAFRSYVNLLSEACEVKSQLEVVKRMESFLGKSMEMMKEREKLLFACGGRMASLEATRAYDLEEATDRRTRLQTGSSSVMSPDCFPDVTEAETSFPPGYSLPWSSEVVRDGQIKWRRDRRHLLQSRQRSATGQYCV